MAEYRSRHKWYTISLHGQEGDKEDVVRELYAPADLFVYGSYHRWAKGNFYVA